MEILLNIGLLIGTIVLMEFVAWFTHKYIMHGLLWVLHKDHHQPHNHSLEKNDSFFLIYSLPSIILVVLGAENSFDYRFWIGLGIATYGALYFFVHDLFIHQRIKVLRNTNNSYLKALRKAHKIHHKHLGKEHGECFGMLVVPFKYYKEAKKTVQKNR